MVCCRAGELHGHAREAVSGELEGLRAALRGAEERAAAAEAALAAAGSSAEGAAREATEARERAEGELRAAVARHEQELVGGGWWRGRLLMLVTGVDWRRGCGWAAEAGM